MKVVFIDTVHPILKDMLEGVGAKCVMHTSTPREELIRIIGNYDGIVIRSRISLDKPFLSKATNLKFIARSGAGMENIDTAFAEEKGITLFNCPEGNRDAVGEHVIGMLLALFNKIPQGNEEVREGKWDREGNRGIEIMGKTVGIIGFGNTGSRLARKLVGFDCTILAHDKYKTGFGNKWVQEVDLDTLLEQSDIISIHIPYTEETHYLIDEEFIHNCKMGVYIVNTSRGKCLNTNALVKGIKSGHIAGACLDVLEFEKKSFEKLDFEELPESVQYIFKSDKVMLTPHVAGWSIESYWKLSKLLGDKILNQFQP